MIRHEVTFNGVNLTRYGGRLATSNFLDSPKRKTKTFSVLGRSGNLILESDDFENFTLKSKVYIMGNLIQNMSGLRSFLNASRGYCKYTETLFPNEYRMACFHSAFIPSEYDSVNGAVELVFDCKPQRYLISGDNPIACADGATITLLNPTLYGSSPIVKVTGTGTFVVGGVTFTLSANTSEVIVDFERGTAYEATGLVDRNGDLTLSADDFPVIPVGESTITATGCSLEIYPRWFNI